MNDNDTPEDIFFATVPYLPGQQHTVHSRMAQDTLTLDEWKERLYVPSNPLRKSFTTNPDDGNIVLASVIGDSVSTPEIGRVSKRWANYVSLSDIGKELMLLIYPDLKAYLSGPSNILEEYIMTFDQVVGDNQMVRLVGQRMGIYIPIDRDFTADDIFIDKLLDILDLLRGVLRDETEFIPGTKLPSIPRIIDMDRTEFDRMVTGFGMDTSEQLFQDRLYLLADLFRTSY